MQRAITINDDLEEILDKLKSRVSDELLAYIKQNPSNIKKGGVIKAPDIDNDLNYDGYLNQVVDEAVPIYDQQIKDLWYLYESEFESAYENAGIGDKSEKNWKACAVYCYLFEKLRTWYEDVSHGITKKEYNRLRQKEMKKCLSKNNESRTLEIPNV